MNANALWQELSDSWRELTERESAALTAEDWSQVTTLQANKTALQTRISELPSGIFGERQVRATLADLMAREQRNLELLTALQHQRRQEQQELEHTRQNLRAVQRSYGGQRLQTAWQSYG